MTVFQFVYSLWLGGCFMGCVASVIPCYLMVAWMAEDRRLRVMFTVNRWAMTLFSWLVAMPIRVEGRHLRPQGAVALVGNHCNLLDMPVCACALYAPALPLAKAEFARVPILGFVIKRFSVLIRRDSAESRRQGAQALVDALRMGRSVLVFPEGTRNRTAEPLQPFRDGVFRAAIAAQVPVQPFVQLRMRQGQRLGTLLFSPTRLVFRYLDPIPTAGLTDADVEPLRETVRARIIAELRRDDPSFRQPA
jgi:1-acyl-sn-glycerol-3-phosphate acyltransferase